MKTFANLKFKPHSRFTQEEPGAEQARMKFSNGTSISVIRGSRHFYCGPGTCEVMTGSDEEVKGYQTPAQITKIMRELQEEEKNV